MAPAWNLDLHPQICTNGLHPKICTCGFAAASLHSWICTREFAYARNDNYRCHHHHLLPQFDERGGIGIHIRSTHIFSVSPIYHCVVSISKQWGEIPGLQVASLYAHHFY